MKENEANQLLLDLEDLVSLHAHTGVQCRLLYKLLGIYLGEEEGRALPLQSRAVPCLREVCCWSCLGDTNSQS